MKHEWGAEAIGQRAASHRRTREPRVLTVLTPAQKKPNHTFSPVMIGLRSVILCNVKVRPATWCQPLSWLSWRRLRKLGTINDHRCERSSESITSTQPKSSVSLPDSNHIADLVVQSAHHSRTFCIYFPFTSSISFQPLRAPFNDGRPFPSSNIAVCFLCITRVRGHQAVHRS